MSEPPIGPALGAGSRRVTPYDPIGRMGANARFWQCIDPATVTPTTGTGLPRVHRCLFDQFRLANHPDDLTHGFIGGNATDHRLDLVGRRAELVPN